MLATNLRNQSVSCTVGSILERRQNNAGEEKEVMVVQHQVNAREDRHTYIMGK